ncbi:MAG TPA: CpsD/CapB family tyrosine-protein kinase [Candidatus Sulfotelmatobacter sp.]|nr:CpsD/CapB family tyrosine-protein kinase [Candidatus Sulfotelmatobacter sp.]
MSHIFDALQKSAAEQSDIETPSALVATELLEATERKTAAERAKTAVLDPEPKDQDVMAALKLAVEMNSASQPISGSSLTETEFETYPAVDQFSQFQSLRVLVPPNSRLVCITEPDGLPAEKFRYLGVRLRQLRQNRPLQKILITSTIPQEGKSMTAANLACALARRTQQKTLLIDGDLRRPTVANLFGLGKTPGIVEWLQGEGSAKTAIYQLEDTGLCVLPAGNVPRNPLELMQSGRLSVLMEQLAGWFDWIVIDSPPVLPLADTSIWMRLADGILLVTRQGGTEKKLLTRGLEAIDQKKLLGALLNSATSTPNSDYYSHYAVPNPEFNSN